MNLFNNLPEENGNSILAILPFKARNTQFIQISLYEWMNTKLYICSKPPIFNNYLISCRVEPQPCFIIVLEVCNDVYQRWIRAKELIQRMRQNNNGQNASEIWLWACITAATHIVVGGNACSIIYCFRRAETTKLRGNCTSTSLFQFIL